MSTREAPTDHAVHPLIRDRHSPRAFSDQALEPAVLRSLLEAARWSASCANEQPWRFIVAPRADAEAFQALLGCLAESNQRWAHRAGALLLSVASTRFAHNGQPNRHAWHDVGMATAQLTFEATARGLVLHPMAGFSSDAARAAFNLPEDVEPVAVVALGYPGLASDLPEPLAQREVALRIRRPQAAFVFGGPYGEALQLAGEQPWDPLLQFWFGSLDADGMPSPAKETTWFRKDTGFDDALRTHFGALHAEILAGQHADWRADPRGRLATIVVLDQLTRNLFRDSADMYRADAQGLSLALEALAQGDDQHAALGERLFLYLPLMHAEDLELQARCLALVKALPAVAPPALHQKLAMHASFAQRHSDIIARFGRFPHRNALLGRASTDEELVFLEQAGSSF